MHFVVMAAAPWETRPAPSCADFPRSTPDHEPRKRIEEAWRRHFSELYRRSLFWANGRREDAEDALGQAAVMALQKLPENLLPEMTLPWLLRLVYSKCMDIHRERRRRRHFVDDLDQGSVPEPVGTEDLESALLESELKKFVRRSISEMPPRLRSVAEPYLLRDQGYTEIAGRLEITEVNVRKRMQEARAHLRQCLRAYLADEARPPAPRGRRPASPSGASPRRRLLLSLAALEEYVRRHPRGWKKRQELALRLREAGRSEEAVLELRLALERQPGQAGLWRDLVSALRSLGRGDEAITACEEASRRLHDPVALDGVLLELEACWKDTAKSHGNPN